MIKCRYIKNCILKDDELTYDKQKILQVIINDKIIFEYDLIDNRINSYKVIITEETETKEYIFE